MIKRQGFQLSLCALLALTAAVPVSAQDAAATIAKAQQTLADIERLLDGIQARAAIAAATPGSAISDTSEALFAGKSLGGGRRTGGGHMGGGTSSRWSSRARSGRAGTYR